MKRILYYVILILFVLVPTSVFADGHVSVSSDSLIIEQGDSKSFTINIYNAIGDIYIKSNDSNVASVNISEWGTGIIDEKQTKSVEVVVTGNNVGKTSIVLTVDAASFGGEDLSDQTKTITISVVDKDENGSLIQPLIPDNNKLQNTLSILKG